MHAIRILVCLAAVGIAAAVLGDESEEKLTPERRAELLDKFPDLKNAEAAYAKAAREANERRALAYKAVIDKAGKGGKFDAEKVVFAKMRLKELESGMDLDGEGQVAGAKIKVLAAVYGGLSEPGTELKKSGTNNCQWIDVTKQVKKMAGDKTSLECQVTRDEFGKGFFNREGMPKLVIRYSFAGKPGIASAWEGSTIRIP